MIAGSDAHWVDGVVGAAIPADDRAVAYGDGLFETIAVVGGRPRLLQYHLDRLSIGCARLGLPCARERLAGELGERAAALGSGILKLIVSRGSGPRGYLPPLPAQPRCIVFATARPEGFAVSSAEPVRVRTCSTPISANTALAGLKHLNRLDQVLARSEWSDPQIAEGLMLDDRGNAVCATAANLFAVRDDVLMTPALERAGVAGVMRRAVLEAAAHLGLTVETVEMPAAEVAGARELLLSSSLTGLRNVGWLDGRAMPSMNLGTRLRQVLDEMLREEAS